MPVLPSTLEYSEQQLELKLKYIKSNLSQFKRISQQKSIELHIDLVYPAFAKDRSVMSSLSLKQNIKIINSIFGSNWKATVHFMGLLDDVEKFNLELLELVDLKNDLEFYIPANTDKKMFVSKFKYFHWYDIDQIELAKSDNNKLLQMTVKAGISGQKLLPATKLESLLLVKQKGIKNVIVDGGWTVEDCKEGIRMVSYSSFWNEFIKP